MVHWLANHNAALIFRWGLEGLIVPQYLPCSDASQFSRNVANKHCLNILLFSFLLTLQLFHVYHI